MPGSIRSETASPPPIASVSHDSSECASRFSAVTHISQSPLALSSQLPQSAGEATCPAYQPPAASRLAELLSRLTPTGQTVLEKIAAEDYCPQPGQSLCSFAQRLADVSPGLTRQDLSIMLETDLASMQAVKLKQVWLSTEGAKAQAIIARDPALARGKDEPRADYAARLKCRFHHLTPRDGALLSGARYGVVRTSSAYTSRNLSAMGQQMKYRIEQGEFPRDAYESGLEYCYRLWLAENQLTLTDLFRLTKVSRSLLERHWVFITCKLSTEAENIQRMLEDPNNLHLKRAVNEDKANWIKRVLGDPARLSRNEAAVIFKLPIKTLNNIPQYISRPLSEAGNSVRRLLESGNVNYQQRSDEDKIGWITRLKRTLEPGLSVTDAAKLTLLTVSALSKYPEFYCKNISVAARTLLDTLLVTPDSTYKRRHKESTGHFVRRIKKLHPKFSAREISMLTNLSTSTIRRVLTKVPKPPRRPAARATVDTSALCPGARRLAPKPAAASIPAPSTAAIYPQARQQPQAPARHCWLLTPVNVQPTYESDYLQAQWVSLTEIDRRLAASGWQRVPNGAFTGSQYANCLIIALLQHAFEFYAESQQLFYWVNYYRDRLVHYRGLHNPNLFSDNGYMAFGNYNDHHQGAAAVLIAMINDMLIQAGKSPLWVVNHSFTASQQYEDRLGSLAENARIVHIVNTGQHFEALLPVTHPPLRAAIITG